MAHLYVFFLFFFKWEDVKFGLICFFSFFFFLFFQYLFDWPSLMELYIIHRGLSVSSVSNRLLNQEKSIEKGITCNYTPGIYAEGYIAFVFPCLRWAIVALWATRFCLVFFWCLRSMIRTDAKQTNVLRTQRRLRSVWRPPSLTRVFAVRSVRS